MENIGISPNKSYTLSSASATLNALGQGRATFFSLRAEIG